jgi:hypothetical protein
MFNAVAMILIGASVLLVWTVYGITGYFRLSSEANALRQSALDSIGGTWDKKIALHVGRFTTALVRIASHHIKLSAEPRAALESVQAAEVGVYKLQQRPEWIDANSFLSRADKTMLNHGWQRVIGVSKADQLVAVYCPKRASSSPKLKCCLAVFDGRELVLASFQGNVEPLLEIAKSHIDLERAGRLFASR